MCCIGLLGIIVEIKLQLKKIPSPFIEIVSVNVRNIEESLELIDDVKDDSDFLLNWVDAFATGNSLGRGIVSYARWHDGKTKLNEKKFFRKGLVDEWKSKLEEHQIKKIEEAFYKEMKELKYL